MLIVRVHLILPLTSRNPLAHSLDLNIKLTALQHLLQAGGLVLNLYVLNQPLGVVDDMLPPLVHRVTKIQSEQHIPRLAPRGNG